MSVAPSIGSAGVPAGVRPRTSFIPDNRHGGRSYHAGVAPSIGSAGVPAGVTPRISFIPDNRHGGRFWVRVAIPGAIS